MNLYEHTIIARQDVSPSQLKQIQEKYTKLVEKFDGSIVKMENGGLMNLYYLIKKNRKGIYIHFKLKGSGKTISELEKNSVVQNIQRVNQDSTFGFANQKDLILLKNDNKIFCFWTDGRSGEFQIYY